MTFKELLAEDAKTVFMNPEEFGEEHIINQRIMICIIDNNEMIEREKRSKQEYRDGVFKVQKLIYVSAKDFGPMPAIGSRLLFDKHNYTVIDAVNEDGIYSISLEANASR